MDSEQVKTFCDAAAALLPAPGNAMTEVSHMTPPPKPPMPLPQVQAGAPS